MVTIIGSGENHAKPALALIMPLQETICTFSCTRFMVSFSVGHSIPVGALSGKLGSKQGPIRTEGKPRITS
jgi:hypothetical protein